MRTARAKYLIIGNSTAAVGGIEGIRRYDPQTPIVLVSREPYHTYSRPLISYLLAGEVDEEKMYYRGRDFYQRNGVDARLGAEATGIHVEQRIVQTEDAGDIAFEKLLIATGGRPIVPDVEGLTHVSSDGAMSPSGVFTFTSWNDVKLIDRYIQQCQLQRAVVVGGGLIGVKTAEALHTRGLDVLVTELADRLLPVMLDARASELAEQALRRAGVQLECGTTVRRVAASSGAVSGLTLRNGRELGCEMIIMAVGVVPNVRLVEGTPLGTDQGILINDRCQTQASGIYAAGDVAQGVDALTGRSRPIPIFLNAYRQGWVAGANMAGGDVRADAMFGMNAMEVFGLPMISMGLATAEGNGCEVLTLGDKETRTYKRIVLKDGRVMGAIVVGNVDRSGILTGLIRQRVDVSEIKDMLISDQFGLISLPAAYRKHVVKGEGIEV